MSYIFHHDLAVVRQIVERVFVLYRGEVVESGPVDEVLDQPKHGYTIRLVNSVPRSYPGGSAAELTSVQLDRRDRELLYWKIGSRLAMRTCSSDGRGRTCSKPMIISSAHIDGCIITGKLARDSPNVSSPREPGCRRSVDAQCGVARSASPDALPRRRPEPPGRSATDGLLRRTRLPTNVDVCSIPTANASQLR